MGKADKNKATTTRNKPLSVVEHDQFRLVVGFEVNHPKAFSCNIVKEKELCTHYLDIDTGHAFFYLCMGDLVMVFISFGPLSTVSFFDSMPARTDYPISEVTKLFNIPISRNAYYEILSAARQLIKDVAVGKELYRIWLNDTCAETIYDVIKKGWKNVPSGGGAVSAPSFTSINIPFNFINPYQWHRNFKKKGYKEYTLSEMRVVWQDLMYKVDDRPTQARDPLVSEGLIKLF